MGWHWEVTTSSGDTTAGQRTARASRPARARDATSHLRQEEKRNARRKTERGRKGVANPEQQSSPAAAAKRALESGVICRRSGRGLQHSRC